ncbi:MAG: extracellular solute-binding protein [Reyranellaceae bacterium]
MTPVASLRKLPGNALGVALAAAMALAVAVPQALAQQSAHGLAMHGDMKYGPDAKHFDYVNPDAPKGGELRLPAIGTFDNFNPYIIKGSAAAGLGELYVPLSIQSLDEPFTEYGQLAEKIETPADRSWVKFTLRPEARWSDGRPITADDVIFTLDILRQKGLPFFRAYYGSVEKSEKISDREVKFTFKGETNLELPLIIGQMPVLPRHYWESREFDRTTLEPPVSSGPYRIKSFEPGRYILYERVKDWWAKDLWLNRGRFNFDQVRYEYYRDATVAFEAFKSGQTDLRVENIARNWATGYDIPAVQNGLIVKREIEHDLPQGMQAWVVNLRRPQFQDSRVRQALTHMFDFEWMNKTLFYDSYIRSRSYFSNSELASSGLPSPEELKILEPLRGQIPEEVFTREFKLPETDGSGNNRAGLREALRLFKEAGWEVKDGKLVKDGKPFEFEILLANPSFERVALPYKQALERIGINASVRTVDTAQFQRRTDTFDFDMIVGGAGQSLSPGNEQREFFGSEAAKQEGSRNLSGISNPAIDRLIELVISAPDREALVTRTRALDRVLLWNWYMIPQWHFSAFRIAYWDVFGMPQTNPKYGLPIDDTWWIDEAKLKAMQGKRGGR